MKKRIFIFIFIAVVILTDTSQIVEIIKYPEEINMIKVSNKENMRLSVIGDRYLVPGGEALKVKLNMKGVLVVGTSEIEDGDGKKYNPALNSGIKVGDYITDIDNIKVEDARSVIKVLRNIKDRDINIVVERDNKKIKTQLKPIKSKQDNSYKVGIWVRDKTIGIGTLTFYDEKTNKFGAIGHAMIDTDTVKPINSQNGEIMKAKISYIEQGEKGNSGEIRGMFLGSKDTLGYIRSNTQFGIYGDINIKEINRKKEKFPVALKNEVKIGKAYILSTIEDDIVEEFEVEVVKVEKQSFAKTKSMIIKVTDKKLLNKTGGIVKGMSGSPIIQNGKIIGAVTHVFVNDPTKGYGIFIEWMLEESDILHENNKISRDNT